ncbi:hypothetical protein CCR75_003876 [Bremia lactucae]|uniref:Uncharacterized protein n=1 Tax=Bremia lactucae TaxID=4779 RepID=A0A976IHV2_BRELC|nr:hypothetical protein CCR75_003876 [Bremia lactucae]
MCIKKFASNSKIYRPIAEAREGVDDDMEGEKLQYTIAAYKAAVLGYEKNAFLTLLCMGRPLWWSTYISESYMPPMEDVEYFAASKLLLGQLKCTIGRAFMMCCRLGLCPRVTSALASHAIADLMATLAYVTYENNGCICSYASDPVLASGAIRVWHRHRNVLESDILPQLRKLILDEVVDTGGLDVMVARVLLLLAMDESNVGRTNYCSHWFGSQFATVYAFLEVLQVCELKMIYSEDVAHFDEAMNLVTFKSWLAQWKDWRMGFTHFVQLQSEPSEDTLWYFLGRRAAGICPRDQDGANLIIPMFCSKSDNASGMETDETKVASDGKVAMILIYVPDQFSIESGFCSFDETKERNAAKETNEKTTAPLLTHEELLRLESVQEVIRINMNLSGEVTPKTPAKFIHYASFGDENDVFSCDSESSEESVEEEATTMGFTFCLNSLDCTTIPFLHEELAQCLASFLGSRLNRIAYVDNDLRHRPNQKCRTRGDVILLKTMPDEKLRDIALDGLGHVPGQH